MFDDTINFPCLDNLGQSCILMNQYGIESVFNAKLIALICFFTFIIDFCIVRCIVPVKLPWIRAINVPDDTVPDDTVPDDSVSEELDDKELFVSRYFDELDELEETELTESDKLYVSDSVLREDTPEGEVIMKYNFKNETFEYYTDGISHITYDILDTLARLFAISYDCKILCVNYRKELEKGENKMKRDIEVDKLSEETKSDQSSSKNTVFVAYKHYNRKSGSIGSVKKYCVITENSNKFKYKGKLEEYETTSKMENELQAKHPVYNISYSEYKDMCKKEL
jgi:hypothetical protein